MVNPGDSILQQFTASKFNNFDAVARAYREGHLQSPRGGVEPSTVRIKNESGGRLDSHSILGIEGAVIDAADDLDQFKFSTALRGTTPATDDHLGRFAILQSPAEADEIVAARVSGLAVCQVNINSASDRFADVKDGDASQLDSGAAGSQIIPVESGTGTKWCIVLLGATAGDTLWQFTLTEGLGDTTANQASATKLDVDGATTGDTITVKDTTASGMFAGLTTTSNGWCFERDGVYRIIIAECAKSGGSTYVETRRRIANWVT